MTPERGGAQRIPRPSDARTGDDPPWAALGPEERRVTLPRVRAAVAGRRARAAPPEHQGARASAVLVPLYEHEGETWVVLTRRARHLRSHRGEVAFPGGGREPEDADLVATALREAHEEVALDPGAVEVVGELDHLATVSSRSYIVPWVGVLGARPDLTPDPAEVDRVLHVPVAELLLPEVYREERWGVPPLDRSIHFFELVGDTVWGATARVLHDLLCVTLGLTGAATVHRPARPGR